MHIESPKLFLKTFGCQMNEYDSAKIVDLLTSDLGFTQVPEAKQANLVVLNTCSVRDKASEKMFSELGRLRLLKNKNRNLVIAVGGCVSMQEKENIFRRAPYVDIVFGPATLHHLSELYLRACKKEKKVIDLAAKAIEKFDYLPSPTKTGAVAYVSIMEGCNKFCSYCIVPYTRGIEISREKEGIVKEVKLLADQGAKEIHLLGQNVNAYKDPRDSTTFSDLIREIAKLKTIERIRFTTSHPAEFDDDLINTFRDVAKLVDHIHLPIQSGSNRILKLMRRGYTRDEYQTICEKLRKVRPNVNISTDFIVGFPGETDADFADSMEMIKKINFDASYSFIYSPRPNTPAAKMDDDVSMAIKKERLVTLQSQLAKQAREYSKKMIGTIQKVLVTNHAKKDGGQFSGRTENNRIVNFSADNNVLDQIVEVKITEAMPNSLRGEFVSADAHHL
jgi:tRNA-2-methylthio-N6-dimethylallyladenosine synthase